MKIINKESAIDYLNKNKIIIMPTDTVYGLMGKFNRNNEIEINKLKNSDINKKISVIFYNKKELFKYIDNLNLLKKIIIMFLLPGKYTFIVKLNKKFCEDNGFERTDFGVRVTKNKELQNIIKITGPLLASSCNKSGNDICTSIESIKDNFNNDKIHLFYRGSLENIASQIYDMTSNKIKKIR